jgi:hypothetical protein
MTAKIALDLIGVLLSGLIEDHENGPVDRAVQEIDTMMRASIVSSGIPMREWCFVAEHMSLVDAMTSYSTSDKSKTIFETVYGFVPDVDSLPPITALPADLRKRKRSLTGSWAYEIRLERSWVLLL